MSLWNGVPVAHGLGEDAPAIALWSLPEHAELPIEAPTVGIVAHHVNGIEKVEFLHEDKVFAESAAESLHTATGEWEFVGSLAALSPAAGSTFQLTARVHPPAGRGMTTMLPPRTFHIADAAARRKWHVDAERGHDESGAGSADQPFRTVGRALRAAKGGDHVLLASGAHELELDRTHAFDRFVTIRPAPDAKPRIVRSGNPRCGMLKFEDLWFDWRGNNSHAIFGAYSAPHYWFKNCRFSGEEGRFDNYTRALKFWSKTTHVTVEGCVFEFLDVAIAAPSDAILRGNIIRRMTSDAFNYNGRTLITGNTITGLRAPHTFIISTAVEPYDFRAGGRFVVTHRETSTDRVHEADLSTLPNPSAARAAEVAEALNRVFAAGKVSGEFGLIAEAVEGRVKITSQRTNYRQTIFVEGPANGALRFAAEGREKAVQGSGQHADVFQSWGGPKGDIIIRNNRAYDNSAQQWLAQDEELFNVAFFNNLLDAYGETYWAVMFGTRMNNVLIEFNTIWNATQSIILRREMMEAGRHRNFIIRNNILGIGTGVGGLDLPGPVWADFNLHDYYMNPPANLGPHSLWTNPQKRHPTESRLFATVQTRRLPDGRWDFYEPNGDFTPAPDSPAVDAADPSSRLRYDIQWRPRDERPDIGAFELQRRRASP